MAIAIIMHTEIALAVQFFGLTPAQQDKIFIKIARLWGKPANTANALLKFSQFILLIKKSVAPEIIYTGMIRWALLILYIKIAKTQTVAQLTAVLELNALTY